MSVWHLQSLVPGVISNARAPQSIDNLLDLHPVGEQSRCFILMQKVPHSVLTIALLNHKLVESRWDQGARHFQRVHCSGNQQNKSKPNVSGNIFMRMPMSSWIPLKGPENTRSSEHRRFVSGSPQASDTSMVPDQVVKACRADGHKHSAPHSGAAPENVNAQPKMSTAWTHLSQRVAWQQLQNCLVGVHNVDYPPRLFACWEHYNSDGPDLARHIWWGHYKFRTDSICFGFRGHWLLLHCCIITLYQACASTNGWFSNTTAWGA